MITLEIDAKRTAVKSGESVFECAERVGVFIPTSCSKQGKCRECLVEVAEGMEYLSARSPEESHLKGNYRLSCRARMGSDQGLIRCHTMRRSAIHIEENAAGLPDINDLEPAVRRDGKRILLDGQPIAVADGPLYGVAVDVGTTTVVLKLIDLETGKHVATQSFENPQRFGGSDVMARICYDGQHKERLLQRALLGYLGHAIKALPCNPLTIYEMVIAGNATMRDIVFGFPVQTIGQAPYRSITEHDMREGKRSTTTVEVKAARLRLPIHPEARVLGLPLISGHVGADAAACMLAIDLMNEERQVALMDIGTNTELLVGNRHRIFAASCPAGPAFEGGLITCGMPALEGAIERVRIRDDASVEYRVIAGGEPMGICGSGLVDVLSELRRTERMNELGRFQEGEQDVVLDREHNIVLSENDVSQLAQAKAANMAGLTLTLQKYGIDYANLDCFYLAGGFARHLDINAARRIGLIPNLPDHKIVQVGNASIHGAVIALKSLSHRRQLEKLVREVTHVELEAIPHFIDVFVEACQFNPINSSVLAETV